MEKMHYPEDVNLIFMRDANSRHGFANLAEVSAQ